MRRTQRQRPEKGAHSTYRSEGLEGERAVTEPEDKTPVWEEHKPGAEGGEG